MSNSIKQNLGLHSREQKFKLHVLKAKYLNTIYKLGFLQGRNAAEAISPLSDYVRGKYREGGIYVI